MSQLLKKYALLAACAALALCFITRPVQAQMVMDGGAGEHLFFAYWTTANYTNTNVNIHSPLGVRGADNPDKNVVYVRVRGTAPDRNTVVSFRTCLYPGDSWTGTLSEEGLMVMDAGECDDDLMDYGSNPGNQNVSPPVAGEMVDLGDTDSGYVEAWLVPVATLKDSPVDTDHSPENAMPRYISGTAMLVSPMSGFSSSYNAVALGMCGNQDDDTPAARTIKAALDSDDETANEDPEFTETDDGNGCWRVRSDDADVDDDADGEQMETMGAPIMTALMGENKDFVTGRWTAINDDNVMSHTKLVLTFPQTHLGVSDGSSDPLSYHIYDDMGVIVDRGIDLMLPLGVNTCMFMPMMEATDDTDAMMSMFSCNDEDVAELGDAMSGEFRIFNNKMIGTPDAVGERGGLEAPAADASTATEVAQNPAESLNAIGLVFSYFEGTDGMEYDQTTPIQWIDIDKDGTGTDDTSGTMP